MKRDTIGVGAWALVLFATIISFAFTTVRSLRHDAAVEAAALAKRDLTLVTQTELIDHIKASNDRKAHMEAEIHNLAVQTHADQSHIQRSVDRIETSLHTIRRKEDRR